MPTRIDVTLDCGPNDEPENTHTYYLSDDECYVSDDTWHARFDDWAADWDPQDSGDTQDGIYLLMCRTKEQNRES